MKKRMKNDFNPNHEFIKKATEEFLKAGGRITKVNSQEALNFCGDSRGRLIPLHWEDFQVITYRAKKMYGPSSFGFDSLHNSTSALCT